MITFVTSFSARGYEEYGRNFLHTFYLNMPLNSVRLFVYHEGTRIERRRNVYEFNLLNVVNDCRAFLKRHEDNAEALGRNPNKRWKQKAIEQGYNFRFDAHKFCRKVFAMRHAKNIVTAGRLFWIDADVMFTRSPTISELHALLPNGHELSFLNRPAYHSECGFVGYNLDSDKVHRFIDQFANLYAKDEVFKLPETHDSFVFDYVRSQVRLKEYPLSGSSIKKGDVWESSPLGKFSIHNKGDRKYTARWGRYA